jgi:hypothetical protein
LIDVNAVHLFKSTQFTFLVLLSKLMVLFCSNQVLLRNLNSLHELNKSSLAEVGTMTFVSKLVLHFFKVLLFFMRVLSKNIILLQDLDLEISEADGSVHLVLLCFT